MSEKSFAESLRNSITSKEELKRKEAEQKEKEVQRIQTIIDKEVEDLLREIKQAAYAAATEQGKSSLKYREKYQSPWVWKVNDKKTEKAIVNEISKKIKPRLINEGFKSVFVSSARLEGFHYEIEVFIRW